MTANGNGTSEEREAKNYFILSFARLRETRKLFNGLYILRRYVRLCIPITYAIYTNTCTKMPCMLIQRVISKVKGYFYNPHIPALFAHTYPCTHTNTCTSEHMVREEVRRKIERIRIPPDCLFDRGRVM